ncbi:MAG TPA: helix-turn-helix domain-containing protein [Gammaproteobacteria bacterium]|nr:helix-turn-helix domain-containing protein [Gammaproteobacteria bacterium]
MKDSESGTPLNVAVRHAMQQYFAALDGMQANNLYDLVLAQIEKPLLESVMQHAKQNQSKAASWLGLSRNTLRKLLAKYNLDIA